MTDGISRLLNLILSPYILPLIFIGGWIWISYSLAKRSGWKELKAHFPFESTLNSNDTNAIKFHSGSGRLGKVYYRGILRIGAIRKGLVLKVYFPFLAGHPPLLIPWSEIAIIDISEPKISSDNFFNLKLGSKITKDAFFAQYAELTLKTFPGLHIEIPWDKSLSERLPDGLRKGISNATLERHPC